MKIRMFALPLASTLILTACSNHHSVGDQMISQSESTKALGDKWNNGEKLIEDGNSLIQEGTKLKEEGKQDLLEGKNKIKLGQEMISESKGSYERRFPTSNVTGNNSGR
jgi:hypothetical protein